VLKEDKTRAGTSLYVTLQVINMLKVLTAPFLPFSAQKLHEMLGYSGDVHKEKWAVPADLPAGQELGTPTPLFTKLDEANLEEEYERLGNAWVDPAGPLAEQPPKDRLVIFEGEVKKRKELGEVGPEWE
jgi:hypothetical protein